VSRQAYLREHLGNQVDRIEVKKDVVQRGEEGQIVEVTFNGHRLDLWVADDRHLDDEQLLAVVTSYLPRLRRG